MSETKGAGASRGAEAKADSVRHWQGAPPCPPRAFSAHELFELTDAGCDWIWETDAELRFSWLSENYETVSGISPDKVLGRFRFDFLKQASSGSKTAAAHLEDLQARRPFRNFVYEMKGGREDCRWISITGYPRFDAEGDFAGYRGIASNVTGVAACFEELRSLRSELVRQEARDRLLEGAMTDEQTGHLQSDLARTIDAMKMGIVLIDRDLKAEIINKAYYDMWKVSPADAAVGSSFRALMEINRYNGIYDVPDAEWETYTASRLDEIRSGDISPREFRRADGRTMVYSVTALSGGKRLVSYYDITEMKNRETQAEEAHEYLADVLESLPAGVVIYDRNDRFVLANRKLQDSLPGLSPVWRAGSTFREALELGHPQGYFRVSGDPAVDALYDSDYTAWLEAYMRRHQLPHNVYERQNPDGRWYKAVDTRTADGTFIGVRVDITEMREREEALRDSMAQIDLYRHVLDELPVSTYVKTQDLAFEFVNKAWTAMTGVPQQAAIGRTDRDFFGEEGEGFADRDLDVLRTGKDNETEETLTHRDGSVRQLIAKKNRLVSSDGKVHLIGSSTDISELKQREAELMEAQRRAVLADRAKSEFLANMSHEIRTPMNGVLGMAELLAKSTLDSKQKTFTEIIVKSGNALLTIINDILDFSKIDAGQLVLDPAPFKLAEAIEDVATLISTRAKEKDLELIVRVAPGLHDLFMGDVGRFRQVVTNLVGNAVKFTDSGHVLVDVSGKPVAGGTKLHISVTDTGIGIPREKLGLVFEKFSQVDASSTRRHEGTGLGLAITARLVALMGGDIGVESVQGEGSTFWFTVTLPNAEGAGAKRVTPLDVTGARILIIDDNQVNRSILLEQMASWTFDSCATENGPEGLRVLLAAASCGVPVDCILLDYQMPGMTGADVARIVRATDAIADTPIVMLTSVDQSLSNSSYRDLAINAQLIKPARSSALLETLVATIQKHRSAGFVEEPTQGGSAALQDRPDWTNSAPHDPAGEVPEQLPASTRSWGRTDPVDPRRIDILVAEDNEVNQLVFTQILTDTDYTFEIVANGRLALKAYGEMPPRMILMDVSMPEMNGLEATTAIRELELGSGRRVPIVGVTAHALKGDRERCLEAGMDDYLPKPISPKALLEKVERWAWQDNSAQRGTG